MRLALEMSSTTTTSAAQSNHSFIDSAFVSELLGAHDVNLDDPLIQAALAQLNDTSSSAGSQINAKGDEEKESKKRKGPDDDAAEKK